MECLEGIGMAAGVMLDAADEPPSIAQHRSSLSSNQLHLLERRREIVVNRPVYTQQEFDETHGSLQPSNVSPWQQMKKVAVKECPVQRNCSSTASMWSGLLSVLPFVHTIKSYNTRQWLVNDIIAGLTVGIMHIPQGMAYSMLATLPPVHGLYTSFFPGLIYMFFGTSRQVSVGTIAIVSLLTAAFLENANICDNIVPTLGDGGNDTQQFSVDTNGSSPVGVLDACTLRKVQFASALSLMVAIIQVIMGLLKLGFVTRYLSDPLLSGFTLAAALHVFTSQLKFLLGLNIPKHSGPFHIPKTYYELFRHIATANLPTLGISFIAVSLLIVFKEVINPKVRAKIKAPIPIELFIVIAGTVVSYFLDLKGNHQVKVVGTIPKGMPQPDIPSVVPILPNIGDCLSVAVISFCVCVSLAKLFGKRHSYATDSNQELLAYGFSNAFGSLFQCYPVASSLSRSAVQDSMGGQTQLATLFSSLLLLFVLLFIGPFFETVPNSCLSAIIIVALKGMFTQIYDLPKLWRFSRWDSAVWLVCALSTLLIDVDYGLLIGVLFSLFTIVLRTQSPTSHLLGRIKDTDIYKNIKAYSDSQPIDGVKVFRYEGSLYYACADHFRDAVYAKTNCDPQQILLHWRRLESKLQKVNRQIAQLTHHAGPPDATQDKRAKNGNGGEAEGGKIRSLTVEVEEEGLLHSPPTADATPAVAALVEKQQNIQQRLQVATKLEIHHVVLDASTWGYVDYVGVQVLTQVIQDYKEIGVPVLIANPKTEIRELLRRSDFYDSHDHSIIYVSVHDAVTEALYEFDVIAKQQPQPPVIAKTGIA